MRDDPEQATGPGAPSPGTRTGLNLQRVLTAALHIADTEGLEALSMRRLAQSLNREAMTLYRYAPNKAALLDGIVDLVLSPLAVDPDAADWRAELRTVGRRFRDLAQAHPNVVPLLATRPEATPLGLRPVGTLQTLEDFLELLTRAGFTPSDALHAYRLFFGFLHGHIVSELHETAQPPEETELLLRLHLRHLPATRFRQLRGLTHELVHYDGPAQLQHSIERMITGLQRFQPRT